MEWGDSLLPKLILWLLALRPARFGAASSYAALCLPVITVKCTFNLLTSLICNLPKQGTY